MENFKPEDKNQNNLFVWLVMGLSFVMPLFFLALTTDFYIFNKTVLFHFWVAVMLLVWVVMIFFKQEVTLLKNPLNLPVLGLVLVFVVSSLTQTPNRMASLTGPGMLMVSLGLLYFIISNHFRGQKPASRVMVCLLVSSVVLAWLTIFAYLGLTEKLDWPWIKTKAWSPTGSPLITATFMAVLLPGTLYWAFKTKEVMEKVLLFTVSLLQLTALLLISTLFIGKTISLNYLWPNFGWQIAVEGFKSLRVALLGVGPGNFLSAFSRFRPVGLNSTPDWAIKFTANSNQYLNLLSTVGVLGLAAYLWLFFIALKRTNFKGPLINKVLYICLSSSFIVQLVFNANLLLLMVTFIFLALFQPVKSAAEDGVEYQFQVKSQTKSWSICAGMALLSLFLCYWQGRIWLADYYFGQSLKTAEENKGAETYNLQIKAIRFNPFAEVYRLTYSATNFALANSLSTKKDLTDQDKTNISQLLSQAIQEAKTATTLNPEISNNWFNLAVLYRNLTNAVKGSEDWAAASYVQAIKTDPTNPLIRLDFGSLFYGLQNYDQAINQFTQTVNLKPDFANGYYNLAAAYKAKEDWVNAYASMQQVVSLIPAESPDFEKVSAELQELKTKLPEKTQEQEPEVPLKEEQKLSTPSPLPSPNPKVGEVKLPKEAAPEIPEEEVEEATKPATP